MTKKDVERGRFFLVDFQWRFFELPRLGFTVIGDLFHVYFEILFVDVEAGDGAANASFWIPATLLPASVL